MDELTDLGQVEGFSTCGAPVRSKRALRAVENVAGDEDDAVPQMREPPLDLGVEMLAVEPGHFRIAENQIVRALAEHLERHGAVVGDRDLVPVALQCLGQGGGDVGLVVDDQDRLPAIGGNGRAPPLRRPARGTTTGSSSRNVAPCPTSLSTVMVPPCSSSVRRQSDRPSPVPSPGGLVVKKGSKIRACTAAGIPGPLSFTSMRTRAGSAVIPVLIASRRCVSIGRIAWIALTTRFTTT
jgi:hypothetical protein